MNTRMKRALAALTIVGLSGVAACSAPAAPTGDGTPQSSAMQLADSPRMAKKEAVLVARQDPGTLDYTKSLQTALLLWIPGNVVEPLLKRSPDGTIGAGIAEYTVDEAGTTYKFKIKPNKFSNGAAITADDVLYSLETMKKSPIANWAAAYGLVTSMEITGTDEITVKLKQPSQSFLQGMAGVAGLIQPKAAASTIATKPIGSGPFVLDEYTSNSRMVFKKNPNYQGQAPGLDTVTVRIVTDGAAGLNALKSGEVDFIPSINNDLWEKMRSDQMDQTWTLIKNPIRGEKQYLVLNANGNLTKDQKVREAFAQSLDRKQIIEALNASWAMIPTCDYGVTSEPWVKEESPETCPYPADAAKAKEAAGALGLSSNEAEFVSLSDVPDLSLPADVLIEQFKAAGIGIKRNPIDLARYSQTIFQARPPQFEVTNMSDPAGITQFICPDAASAGWTTYCSKEFTELARKADTAKTVEEYQKLLGEANEVLKKDAVIVPLSATIGIGLSHPKLKGGDAPSVIFGEVQLAPLTW